MPDGDVVADPCLCGINLGGLCDKSCEVVQQSTLDDLYRVYLPERVLSYTSAAHGVEGIAESKAFFDQKFRGRVRQDDWEIDSRGPDSPAQLWLLLPVLKAEFKHREAAEGFRAAHSWPDEYTHLVVRNSKDERDLLDYGRKLLPSDQQ